MEKADRVIAVSTNTAQDATRLLDVQPAEITTIFNGIDAEFRVLPTSEVMEIRKQYTKSSDTFCLLNVGSTHQRKNIFTVLRVLKTLKEKGLPVCLWRTGSDFTKAQIAFIQEHDLESDIYDLGSPDKARLIQIYNAADVLLAPSLYEGFGLTIVEAMACGVPVITSNVSSLPEVAGDAAILVDPSNVEAIIEAIFKTKQDPSYRDQLIEKGLVRAKFFSWLKTAEQVAQVYENVLLKKSSELVK
jgi:glycosyltransferase involved in cell wall biosynthesis